MIERDIGPAANFTEVGRFRSVSGLDARDEGRGVAHANPAHLSVLKDDATPSLIFHLRRLSQRISAETGAHR